MRRPPRLFTLFALIALVACADSRTAIQQGILGGPASAIHDFIISRVMVDPTAVSDEHGEWFEIANLEADSADLRGWRVLSQHDAGFVIPRSLVVPPGGTVILGRNADSTTNGGVHVDLMYSGIVLGNAGDWLVLKDSAGVTADSVAWDVAPRGTTIDHRASPKAAPRADSGVRPQPRSAMPRVELPPPASTPADVVPAPVSPRELVVRVLDIGQGDAILIQNGGSTVLVDGGPRPDALGRELDTFGLNGVTIDAVILTHAHADHYQGLRELFASRRHIAVRYFWENQDPSPNITLGKLRDSVAARARAGLLVYRDTDDPCATGTPICTITLKGGARLHIMQPDPDGEGPNNRSPGIKLVGPDSASFTMWIAGDAEGPAIEWFTRAGYARSPGMHVDVLKADHHGSCNGVSDAYLDLLQPSLVVVSLGALNDYGHMHVQAKTAYERHHVPWYRTDQNGTITLRSAGTPGSGYSVTVERGAQNSSGPSDRRSAQAGCAD